MTKARDTANLVATGVPNSLITLDAAEIPNLDTAKITTGTLADARIPNLDTAKVTTGTFANARISEASVSQHASSFDDNKIVNDISTLALRQASNENKGAYNSNSMSVDVFQDDTGIDAETNTDRNVGEYIDTVSATVGGLTTLGNSNITVTTVGSGSVIGGQSKLFDGSLNPSPGSDGTYLGVGSSSANATVNGDNYIKFVFDQKYKMQTFNCYSWSTNGRFSTLYWAYSEDQVTYNFWDCTGSGIASGTHPSANIAWSNSAAWANHTDNSGDAQGTIMKELRVQPTAYHNNGNSNSGISELGYTGYPYSETINATGNFTGTTITAPSSTSSMGAIITYQDEAGTNALNTDIILKLSADGGSNYTTATLVAMPDFSTGIKMAKVNDLTIGTAGTTLKYQILFANQSASKTARIRGVSLQY